MHVDLASATGSDLHVAVVSLDANLRLRGHRIFFVPVISARARWRSQRNSSESKSEQQRLVHVLSSKLHNRRYETTLKKVQSSFVAAPFRVASGEQDHTYIRTLAPPPKPIC